MKLLLSYIFILCGIYSFATTDKNETIFFSDLNSIDSLKIDSIYIAVKVDDYPTVICGEYVTRENFFNKDIRRYMINNIEKAHTFMQALNHCSFICSTNDNSEKNVFEFVAGYKNGKVTALPFPTYNSPIATNPKGCIIMFSNGNYRVAWFSSSKELLYGNYIFNMSDEFYNYILNP